ncbi:MAG: TldD/PmbA family protein [Candidatus Bathyarchaeales archaeon]
MELGELTVKKALSMGVTEAEVYIQRTKTIRVEFSEEIENFKTVESIGMSLRVALGKKIAMYSTSILDESEISEAAARAAKIAKVAPEDPHWKHINKKFGKAPAEGYYDETLENLDYQEIVETLNSAVNRMKDYDERVRPTRGFLTTSISDVSIANSYNESCERKETNIDVWMRTKAEEAGMKSTGTEHQEARFWKEINFEDLSVKAAKKAVKFLRAKPISSGKMSVIIRNQIFANIIGGILSGPINADWVQKGRSPLSNKLGTQIASENINIVDDGIMRGGWQTKPFDDEGHPTQRTPVVEKGILKNYLYDTYTALKDNVDSTGNAQRLYYWMKPQPSPNNLILKSGEAYPEEIIHGTRKGIYIEETIGEWLSNPVSGNLNATVTHGYLVENGELTEPIKGVVISGNFYELLKNGIEIIGNDLRNSMQNYSPTVKLTQLTIAGK